MEPGDLPITIRRGATFTLALTYCTYRRPAKGLYGDAAMTAASAVLTSPTAGFTTADVGRSVRVRGAGVGGADLVGAVASWQSTSQVTLATPAVVTVSGADLEVFVPLDLTGCTAQVQFRTPAGVIEGLGETIVLGGAAGTITVTIAAAATQLLVVAAGEWGLRLVSGSGVATDLLRGSCSIVNGVIL
jgi:hypothetical protein